MLYSVDSMSTRGGSGLTLQRHWRMMGALEAGDGTSASAAEKLSAFLDVGRAKRGAVVFVAVLESRGRIA